MPQLDLTNTNIGNTPVIVRCSCRSNCQHTRCNCLEHNKRYRKRQEKPLQLKLLEGMYEDLKKENEQLLILLHHLKLKTKLYQQRALEPSSILKLVNRLGHQECDICCETYTEQSVRLLKCTHPICNNCLKRVDKCPHCRESFE